MKNDIAHALINKKANKTPRYPQNGFNTLQTVELMEEYHAEKNKEELTDFLQFLLAEGYCDSDVYTEPPSAVDRYLYPELRKK